MEAKVSQIDADRLIKPIGEDTKRVKTMKSRRATKIAVDVNTKDLMQEQSGINNFLTKLLDMYGPDYNEFNTVADNSLIPFWLMQLMRMLFTICLVVLTVLYAYIYFRQAVVQWNFWTLFMTTVA